MKKHTQFYNSLWKLPFSTRKNIQYIPLEKAKQKALEHAKINPADADEIHISHLIRLDTVIYAFAIKKASQSILYQINAASGEIISSYIQPAKGDCNG